MDTEGLASIEEDAKHDLNIFTIAMLSCTHFIYNSIRTIDEDALNKLFTCIKIASEVKDYKRVMPSFTWVVRDCNLNIENS